MGEILYEHDSALIIPTRSIVDYGSFFNALRTFKDRMERGLALAPAAARYIEGEGNAALDGLKRLVIAHVNDSSINVYVAKHKGDVTSSSP